MVHLLKHYVFLFVAIIGGLFAFGLLANVIDWVKGGCKGPLFDAPPEPEPPEDITLPDNIEDLEYLFRELAHRKENRDIVLLIADRAEELGDRTLPLDAAKLYAKRAYHPRDMAHAWLRLRHAAELGCVGAREALSEYESSHCMEIAPYFDSIEDSPNAIHCYRLAAKQKYKKAYLPLAKHLSRTAETAAQWQEAYSWAQLAESVKKGDPTLTVKTKLNTLLARAREAEAKSAIDDSIDAYLAAARMGNPMAAGQAVRLLHQHWVSIQDYEVLCEMMDFCQTHGVYDKEFLSMSMQLLEPKYLLSKGMQQAADESFRNRNYEEALNLALQGSDAGNAECAILAASIYSGHLEDHAAALEQLKHAKYLARRKPFPKSFDETLRTETILSSKQAFLDAIKYYRDFSTQRNLDAAIAAIQPAIDAGSTASAAAAAKFLSAEGSTSKDMDKAIEFANLAIQQGDRELKTLLPELKSQREFALGMEAEKREFYLQAIEHYKKAEKYFPDTNGYRRAVFLFLRKVDPFHFNAWDEGKELVRLCKFDRETTDAYLRLFDQFNHSSPLAILEFRELTSLGDQN